MTLRRHSPLSTLRRKAAAVATAGVLAAGIAAGSASAVAIEDAGYDPDAGINTLGYWMVASDGGVFTHGQAKFYGSLGATKLNAPIVGITTNVFGGSSGAQINDGYYLVAADGGVFSFGDKEAYPFLGSTGDKKLNSPIVGMALSPLGGYYLVAADGGVFAFGGAPFHGSLGNEKLNTRVVGMVASADPIDGGYYLAGADGSVWTFGSTGDIKAANTLNKKPLNAPISGIDLGFEEDAEGNFDEGVYLSATDGGVFGIGAQSYGSAGATRLNSPVVGISTGLGSEGYTLTAADGGIFPYGDNDFYGSQGANKLNKPVVGIAGF